MAELSPPGFDNMVRQLVTHQPHFNFFVIEITVLRTLRTLKPCLVYGWTERDPSNH